MGNFSRDGKRSGGRGFSRGGFGGSRPSFGGGRSGGDRQMHTATCSDCGNECQVPFRPTGEKPVFCSSCFEKHDGGGIRSNRFGGDRHERRERSRSEDREMFTAVCDKCAEECQVPFRPTPGKPIFCDNCFEKTSDRSGRSSGNTELMEQIKLLNEKFDKLMNILAPNTPKEKAKKVEVVKEVKAKKEKTIKKVVATKEKKVATKKVVAPKKVVAKKKK